MTPITPTRPTVTRPFRGRIYDNGAGCWFGRGRNVGFVIKSTLNDDSISLKDMFMGALSFAFVMLLVLLILIEFPILSLALL